MPGADAASARCQNPRCPSAAYNIPSGTHPRGTSMLTTPARLVSLLAAWALLAPPARAETFTWRTATPQSQGLDAAKLEAFRAALAERKTKALLILRNDHIVCEWYAPGHAA